MKRYAKLLIVAALAALLMMLCTGALADDETSVALGNMELCEPLEFTLTGDLTIYVPYHSPMIKSVEAEIVFRKPLPPGVAKGSFTFEIDCCTSKPTLVQSDIVKNGKRYDEYQLSYEAQVYFIVEEGTTAGNWTYWAQIGIHENWTNHGVIGDVDNYYLEYTVMPYALGLLHTVDADYRVSANGKNLTYLHPNNFLLKTQTVPNKVTLGGKSYGVNRVGKEAFYGYTDMVTCKLGSNIKYIDDSAFMNCTKLKTVTGAGKVYSIGDFAFSGCKRLASISTMMNSAYLKTIGESAFANCVALKSVVIPAKVVSIGARAFYGCKILKTINIKTKLLTSGSIGYNAFGGKVVGNRTWKVPAAKKLVYRKLLIQSNATDVSF